MGSTFIDLTKVFDTVIHDIQISNKLNYYYVYDESLSKLKDYFLGRKQFVRIDSKSSEELAITSKSAAGVYPWTAIVYYCQFSVLNSLRNIIMECHLYQKYFLPYVNLYIKYIKHFAL